MHDLVYKTAIEMFNYLNLILRQSTIINQVTIDETMDTNSCPNQLGTDRIKSRIQVATCLLKFDDQAR